MVKTFGFYINTDDIKRTTIYDNLEVAIKAKELRESLLKNKKNLCLKLYFQRIEILNYISSKLFFPSMYSVQSFR